MSISKYVISFLLFLMVTAGYIAKGQTIAGEKDIFSVGVGFGGGLGGPGISYSLLPDYSGTITPGILITYEHVFDGNFGVGGMVSFATASLKASNIPYTIYDAFGNVLQTGTLSDQSKGTYIGIAARPTYHFKSKTSFDPYVGVIFGYTLTSFSSTVTTAQGSYAESSFYPGILFGAFAGARVYVTKQVGLWLEAGYSGIPDYLVNVGVAYKLGKF